MTQPGTTGNAIPRGRDWIARDLADLRRMIRRLGANVSTAGGGGAVLASAVYQATTPAFSGSLGWEVQQSWGDAGSYFVYDGYTGIQLIPGGWFSLEASVEFVGADDGDLVYMYLTHGGFDTYAPVQVQARPRPPSSCVLHLCTAPFYVDPSHAIDEDPVTAIVNIHQSGSGASPSSYYLTAVKYAD